MGVLGSISCRSIFKMESQLGYTTVILSNENNPAHDEDEDGEIRNWWS